MGNHVAELEVPKVSLLCPLMYSLRGNVCGVVYISAPTSSHSDLYSTLS